MEYSIINCIENGRCIEWEPIKQLLFEGDGVKIDKIEIKTTIVVNETVIKTAKNTILI